ncbi:hypothetical protein BC834DRAFT_971142 [Gloeopeniophorella convolvens]|nr:hypothetical protein BC834DRAFT_971142 [Gloeopeniophorella convolvens]
MKVVRPEWLVDSVKAGVLLSWQDFIFTAGGRVDKAQGRQAQTSLTEFVAAKPYLFDPATSYSIPEAAPGNLPPREPSLPEYAEHKSNVAAERAMTDPAWRAAHTSAAPGFIAGYYANSRLHHLSAWKAELRTLVAEAQECAERGDIPASLEASDAAVGVSMRGAALALKSPLKGKGKAGGVAERVIMHVDFDAFFVSAGLVERPHLRGKPVVVCHSQGVQGGASSTSEIASASYEARKFGIKNGMSLQQARKLCPNLITMPYEFERYKQLSLKFYTILMSHADDLQAVSVDEALIDVTSTAAQMRIVRTDDDDDEEVPVDNARELADSIRAQIRAATGCEASIGIAPNIMLARLATRRAKPAGSFHLLPTALPDLLPTLDIQDLHGFGRAHAALCDALGKSMGETLYKAVRGIDERRLESDKPRKSVSCDINYGIRFDNDEQAEAFVHQMSAEVARRLDAINMKGVEAPKFMGHGQCVTYSKQAALAGTDGRATSDPRTIGALSWRLLSTLRIPAHELRGIAIQMQKLETPAASGKGRLPFRPAGDPEPRAETSARAAGTGPLDLPAFSQVDPSVLAALPDDIRTELEAEYRRRSAGPARPPSEPRSGPAPAPVSAPARRAASAAPHRGDAVALRVRGTGNASRGWRGALSNNTRPTFQPARGRGGGPTRSRWSLPAPPPPAAVRVERAELAELGFDADVFFALPVGLQREQLAAARGARVRPSQQPVRAAGPLRPLTRLAGRWAPPRGAHEHIPPPPAPRACFAESVRPALHRADADAEGGRADGADVRAFVRGWVVRFVGHAPHAADVERVAGYVARCGATDAGAARAVGVLRWWAALLRRRWAVWEHAAPREEPPGRGEDVRAEAVGMAWWAAHRALR